MNVRLIHAAALMFVFLPCVSVGTEAMATGHRLPRHARAARVQAQQLHHALTRQFHLSPFAPRLCEITQDIEVLACQIERELRTSCSNRRAMHLIRKLDRKVCQLNSVFRTANHRARIGVDPPVGCTLGIQRKLDELTETAQCLKRFGRDYHPAATRSFQDYGRSQGFGRDSYDVYRSNPHLQPRHSRGGNSSCSQGSFGFSLQRGAFRLSFGG